MHVTIIGPGALGLFVGQRLLRAGAIVRFWGRQGSIAVDEVVLGPDGPFHVEVPASQASDISKTDLVFITVKAFDLAKALEWTRQVQGGTPVIAVVNGAVHRVLEREHRIAPGRRLRVGACTVGVSRVASGFFEQRSVHGDIHYGPLDHRELPSVAESTLAQKDPKYFVWEENMQGIYQRKWLYNTVINTLTAVHRLSRNGDLLEYRPEVSALFEEAFRLGNEIWGTWIYEKDDLFNGMIQLIKDTEANENSMARDVRLGRRTESLFLAGLAGNDDRFPLLKAYHQRLEDLE